MSYELVESFRDINGMEEEIEEAANPPTQHANPSLWVPKFEWSHLSCNTINNSKIYMFIYSLLSETIAKFPNDPALYIIYSYFEFYYRGHPFQALQHLFQALKNKPPRRIQFEIFHHRRVIESSFLAGYNLAMTQTTNFIDTLLLNTFQNAFNQSMDEIYQCSELMSIFWEMLLKEQLCTLLIYNINLATSQLNTHAKYLFEHVNSAVIQAKQVILLHPDNLHFLFKYGMFQNNVLNNEHVAGEIFKRLSVLDIIYIYIYKYIIYMAK